MLLPMRLHRGSVRCSPCLPGRHPSAEPFGMPLSYELRIACINRGAG